jgi:hypothetical protein
MDHPLMRCHMALFQQNDPLTAVLASSMNFKVPSRMVLPPRVKEKK